MGRMGRGSQLQYKECCLLRQVTSDEDSPRTAFKPDKAKQGEEKQKLP